MKPHIPSPKTFNSGHLQFFFSDFYYSLNIITMSSFSSLSHKAQDPPEDRDHTWGWLSPTLSALGLAKYQWDTRMRTRETKPSAHIICQSLHPGGFSALLCTWLRPCEDVKLKRLGPYLLTFMNKLRMSSHLLVTHHRTQYKVA